ncbi:MAG TPA: hypothetical protein VLB50_06470 [Ignavibacteriaceae bacterium]|nr:hypothetical protein [Ignavibacteriaceae bacterium]
MKTIAVIFIVPLLLIQSCKDNSNPSIPVSENFVYPLKIGNEWTYNTSTRFVNITPDSIKYLLIDRETKFRVLVKRDTVLNSHPVFELMQSIPDEMDTYGYYANEDTGFIKYGYRNGQGGILWKPVRTKFLYKDNYYDNISELIGKFEDGGILQKPSLDDIIILEEPLIIYPYPLYTGKEWSAHNPIFGLTKKVVGQVIVSTPAGYYLCYKIRWNYLKSDGTVDYNTSYFEYINQKGLLKKVMTFKNITITTAENPDGIGSADVEYEAVAEDINF